MIDVPVMATAMVSEPRRHIIFMLPSLRGGGAERVMVTLLRHLDRSKFRLTLAVIDMSNAVYAGDVPADVELVDLRSRRVRHALPQIAALIWRRKPDLVFSTLGHLNLALAVLRIFLPNRVRYIAREATMVSSLPGSYAIPGWWFWLYRKCYARFDLVVCQSVEMQEDLISNFRIPRSRTVVIYNPVDIERIRALCSDAVAQAGADGTIRLVAAGSLTHVKGFDLLIEAVAQCRERRFHLTILGDGPLLAGLEGLAAQRGLSAAVTFAGFKKNPYTYFRDADALVLSSRFEGFPNVVLESLACGTPVIATPCPGGVREILAGMEGSVLADDCSAEALRKALTAFDFGRRVSSAVVDRYAVASIVARYEELFCAVAAGPNPVVVQ